jgi:hypothetical protein
MRNVKLSKSRNVTVAGVNRVYFVLDLQVPLNGEFVSREFVPKEQAREQKGERQ